MLFEMIAGRAPWAGENANLVTFQVLSGKPPRLRDLAPEVPLALDEIVMRAFSPNRAQRFASAREMRMALEQYVHGRTGDVAAADALEPGSGARAKSRSISLEVIVEPPAWRPPPGPLVTEHLAPSPERPFPPPREVHAAVARRLEIDDSVPRRPRTQPRVEAAYQSDYAVIAAARGDSLRRARIRRSALMMALLLGLALTFIRQRARIGAAIDTLSRKAAPATASEHPPNPSPR
jgi:hypothetical protein